MIMLRSINLRSFLIGGLLVFSVMCLMGAIDFAPPETLGRFQFTTYEKNAFIIDTATGQLWSQYFSEGATNVTGLPPDEFHAPKLLIGSHVIESDDF